MDKAYKTRKRGAAISPPTLPTLLLLVLALACTAGAVRVDNAVDSNSGAWPDPPPLGRDRLSDFAMEPGYTNLNHGSYGATPRCVLEQQKQWLDEIERHTELWLRWQVYPQLLKVREVLSLYLGCANPSEIVMVPNASTGINALLRSLAYTYLAPVGQSPKGAPPGIIYFSVAYQMVKNTLLHISKYYAIPLHEVAVTFPTSHADIVAAFEAALAASPRVGVAVFSHITSTPSFIMPVVQLAEVCRRHGILVVVDGAHAPGQIPLSLPSLGVDFYVGNGHKWLYSPKGTAFLWVRSDLQHLIYPTTISEEGQGFTPFEMEFSWEGTNDYSRVFSLPRALEYRKSLGEARIMEYMHTLACSGGRLLARMWRTRVLVPDDNMVGAMVNVVVPTANGTVANAIGNALLKKHNLWVPVFAVGEVFVARVSAQIYNDMSDFEMLGRYVLDIIAGL